MISDWVDKTFIGIMIAFFCGIVYLMVVSEKRWDECESKGGVVLKASGGYICAKVERI